MVIAPKILSLIPPLVQINTPYPSTSFLTGFLRSRGYEAHQRDLGLELVLRLFSSPGLESIRDAVLKNTNAKKNPTLSFFLEAYDDYHRTIEPVIRFMQGKDPALAHRIAQRTLLPEGPSFLSLEAEDLSWAFGSMGVIDQAKHIASLYIDDLTRVISEGVDSGFSLSRYAEKLAASQPSFEPLLEYLEKPSQLVDGELESLTREALKEIRPNVLLLSVPFPGCVAGALKIARTVRKEFPEVKIVMGGGYVNTELRTLKDARVFEYVHALTLDDGERPIECLLEYWFKGRPRQKLLRTFLLSEKITGEIEYCNSSSEHDIPQIETGYPTADGLPVGQYISMVEMLNPMHRFWSDLYWNKLMLAHGCYWHQCSFCDVTLDYIRRYEISPARLTVERMKRLAQETQSSGFHFVDEAAPPALLKALSKELIEEKLSYTWWGNIRFEKSFNQELTQLMSDAGCVAVSGGLEVASDRLLAKMKKGVTVEQVARVTKNFSDSGVMVHAYLMYGFPGQTEQETIDSLERVRQLFVHGCIASAFWHRFSATAHSAIGHAPDDFGVTLFEDAALQFARNDLAFSDASSVDHGQFSAGLKKAVYNYMLGIGLEADVREWFEFDVSATQVSEDFVYQALKSR